MEVSSALSNATFSSSTANMQRPLKKGLFRLFDNVGSPARRARAIICESLRDLAKSSNRTGKRMLLRYRYMTASFPLVYRKGRPLYCRRFWESDHTHNLVIPCNGDGPGQLVAKTEPEKGLSAACYVRLTTRVSQTNA